LGQALEQLGGKMRRRQRKLDRGLGQGAAQRIGEIITAGGTVRKVSFKRLLFVWSQMWFAGN
jgi:hypothetical protein